MNVWRPLHVGGLYRKSLFGLLLLSSACHLELPQEVERLKAAQSQLESQNRKLQQQLVAEQRESTRLRRLLRERSSELVASRMGIPDPETQLFATLKTSLGEIRIRLDWKEAPYTVQNFVALAEGARAWRDPKTGEQVRRPFYDGLTFHRVIPGFMIQTGDPKADGSGGPGYQFPDELVEGRHPDRAGWVGMANTGPDTNGSQFFILDGPAVDLEGRHTLFGEVVQGQEVVTKITQVERDKTDKPLTPVTLEKVRIERVLSTGSRDTGSDHTPR